MFLGLFLAASSSLIAESVITGCGLGVGLYCASKSGKITSMPKKAK